MTLKPYTILLIVLFNFQVQAQSLKSKGCTVQMPNYAEQLAPEQCETYWGEIVLGPEEVLNFTKDEFQKALQLEDFMEITGDQSPDMFFAINGISEGDLEVTGTIAPLVSGTYSINIIPKDNTSIKLLFYYKGELTQLWQIPILPKVDVKGTKIPTTINFSEDDKEKYLMLEGNRAVPDISPYMVEKYLDEELGENFLNKIINTIQDTYDNNMAEDYISFYYVKDKKNKSLIDETKDKLSELEALSQSSFTTLEGLRTNKQQLDGHFSYWKDLLPNYQDPNDKKMVKIKLGILMNLYHLSVMVEDFNSANNYLEQASALDVKSGVVKLAQKELADAYARYKLNYQEATGERKYSKGYEINPITKIIKVL